MANFGLGRRLLGAGEVGGFLGGGGRPEIAPTLVFRAEPADEAALLFRRALVVEGDEAGEEFLLSCVLCLGVLCLDRKITPPVRLEDGGDVPSPLILGDRRSPPRSFSSTLYISVRVSPG